MLPPNVAQFAKRVNTENDEIQNRAMRVFEKLKNAPRKVKAPKLPPVPKEQEDVVMAMGFTTQQARVALRKFKNETQQAVLWLLSTPIASSAYQEAATLYQDREDEKEEKKDEEEEEEEEKVAEEDQVEEKQEDEEPEKPYAFGRGLAKRAIASEILMILRCLMCDEKENSLWFNACRSEIEQAIFKCPSTVTTSLEPMRTHIDEMSRVSSALASLAVVGAGWDSIRLGGLAKMNEAECIVLSVRNHLERRNTQHTKSLVHRRQYSAREGGTVVAVFQGKSSSLSVSLPINKVVPVEEVSPPIRNDKLISVLIRLATRVMDVDSVAATSSQHNATCGEAASALAISTLRAFCARAVQSALHDPEACRKALTSNMTSLLLAVASQAAPESQLTSLSMIERRAMKLSGTIEDCTTIRHTDPPLPSLDMLKSMKKSVPTVEEIRRRELAKDLLVYVMLENRSSTHTYFFSQIL